MHEVQVWDETAGKWRPLSKLVSNAKAHELRDYAVAEFEFAPARVRVAQVWGMVALANRLSGAAYR